ncbi:MAG: ABC transporter ATP-binding protein [Clostridia bacterium]|jgi:iron complex transport system ATP-binding protein|nr:ABC transporter ATP-binding protein [Clostridiales bacterium]
MSIIEARKASFSYGELKVLENIDLKVEEGEIFCLFGPNGCGKTTFIQCLLGILKTSSGTIRLRGRDIRGMKTAEIARELAYIPQVHEKPFPYKVMDVVLMGRVSYTGLFSLPKKEDRKTAEEALKRVGMLAFKDKPYTQLSGGETQLVMVARALAQQTPVLVMDEPTAHLDFRNELVFLETIVRLVKDTKITVVMATHFPNHAFYFENSNIASRVALMNERMFYAQGSPDDVLTERNMYDIFRIKSKLISHKWEEGSLKQILPIKTYV